MHFLNLCLASNIVVIGEYVSTLFCLQSSSFLYHGVFGFDIFFALVLYGLPLEHGSLFASILSSVQLLLVEVLLLVISLTNFLMACVHCLMISYWRLIFTSRSGGGVHVRPLFSLPI